jgi:hypothetical protein
LWRLYLGFSEKNMPEALVGDIVIVRASDEETSREWDELEGAFGDVSVRLRKS